MATLRQLRTFLAVAEYKRMSEAAKKLYISQPTVSQIISDLENEYKTQLFERFPKELKITPAGQILLNNAREIISLYKHLEDSMKNLHLRRSLNVGATITVGNTLMGTLIENLIIHQPDIDAMVSVDNMNIIEQKLIHKELDIALVEDVITHQEIMAEPVIEDSLCLICGYGHSFAGKHSVRIEDLRYQSFIMWERGSGTRNIFENIMLTHHIPYNIKWECSSRCGIVDAVRHNLGLGILSERCARDYIAKGDVFSCSIENVSMKHYFYLCRHQHHSVTSQMQDFMDTVYLLAEEETAENQTKWTKDFEKDF